MIIENESDLKEIVTSKLQEILEVSDKISEDLDLVNIGLDSFKSISLIVNLEEQFDIVFDDNELILDNFSTVSKIVDRVSKRLEEK